MSISRVMTVLFGAFVALMGSAVAASASTEPVTWPAEEDPSALYWLTILIGIPAAIAIVLTVFALATARRNFKPEIPTEVASVDAH